MTGWRIWTTAWTGVGVAWSVGNWGSALALGLVLIAVGPLIYAADKEEAR